MDLNKPSQESIQWMFDRLSKRYDWFNRLSSMGMDGIWRRETLRILRPGMKILDLGCGTGDLSIMALEKSMGQCQVVGLDFSEQMLAVARMRCQKKGYVDRQTIQFVQKSAEHLPLGKPEFDLVVSGFVLRNIYEKIDQILNGVYLSLAESGRISFVDITEPANPLIGFGWKLYMRTVVALYGRLLFGKDYPILYLTRSAERFLKAEEFMKRLSLVGFKDIRVKKSLFGIICHYEATK